MYQFYRRSSVGSILNSSVPLYIGWPSSNVFDVKYQNNNTTVHTVVVVVSFTLLYTVYWFSFNVTVYEFEQGPRFHRGGTECSRYRPGHPRLQADNAIVGSSTPRFLHHSTTDRAVSSVGRRRSLSAGALEVQHGVETACHQTDNTACKAGPPRPGTVPAEFRALKSTRQPPVGGATRRKEQRIRGASGRVIETRLGELRADKNKRYSAVHVTTQYTIIL